MTLLIDGTEATAAALVDRLSAADGHSVTLQVRAGGVRGFDLALERLDRASRVLFGSPAPLVEVRRAVARALHAEAGTATAARAAEPGATAPIDATLRIEVFADNRGDQRVLVEAREAESRPRLPHRLEIVQHDRLLAGVDHTALGVLPLLDREARRRGFDGALVVSSTGLVVEVADGVLGLTSGRRVVWPEGPALDRAERVVLGGALRAAGVTAVVLPVKADELAFFEGAFVVCPRGAAPVASIGTTSWPDPSAESLVTRILTAYDALPYEPPLA